MTLRNWCACLSFAPGYPDFPFGTVQAEEDHEAEAFIITVWAEICPHPVTTKAVIPGLLTFHEE